MVGGVIQYIGELHVFMFPYHGPYKNTNLGRGRGGGAENRII